MKTIIWLAVIALGIVWSCMIFYMLYWGKQIKNLANKYNDLSDEIEKIQSELSFMGGESIVYYKKGGVGGNAKSR